MESFAGLFFVAMAVFLGLSEIAGAIRRMNINVTVGTITIKGYHDE